MEEFCEGGRFWDTELLWNNSWPQFTECFQRTVIIWVPSAWLWIVSPVYLLYLRNCCTNLLPVSWKYIFKLILCVALFILSTVQCIKAGTDLQGSNSYFKATLMGPVVQGLTVILAMMFLHLERKKGFVTSGVMFLYWFLVMVADIIPFYSNIKLQKYLSSLQNFVVFNLYMTLVILQVVLSCLAEVLPQTPGPEPCPELRASFLSRITYWWLNGMMFVGYKRPLTESDMYSLHQRDMSQNVVARFQEQWQKEWRIYRKEKIIREKLRQDKPVTEATPLLINAEPNEYVKQDKEGQKKKKDNSDRKPSLMKALMKTFWKEFLFCQFWQIFDIFVLFINPVLLKLLIQYTEDKAMEEWKGFLFVGLFFTVTIFQSLCFQQMVIKGATLSLRFRAAIVSAIFRKSLTITNNARKASTVGEIVNLMSTDVEHIRVLVYDFWLVWSCPVEVCLCLYFLYSTLGSAIFAGLGALAALFPLQIYIMVKSQKLKEEEMKKKDDRIKLLTEVLNGIKILKLYAWEMSFQEKVLAIRNIELGILKKAGYLSAVMTFGWLVSPFVVSLVAFGTYAFASGDHYLDAQKAFVALSYFNILRYSVNVCPYLITDIIKSKVSMKRITEFLHHDDLDRTVISHDDSFDAAIRMKDATFTWNPEMGTCLKNININVPEGSLVAVVGKVGAGKSSLISSILGEMEKNTGSVNVKGTVAYVPQQAWIQNASLKDNILFGNQLTTEKYETILECCALNPDLDSLPAGDLTEIGEKGINLSGGQKQRVSLARAVYFNADIYLLDDPLSAVDCHVGKHIFDKVVSDKGLLANKTRVLVTHGVHWLPKVDHIVVLSDGIITETGTYDQLMDHDGPFAQFLRTYLLQTEESEDEDDEDHEMRVKMLERLTSIQSDDLTDDELLKHNKRESESDGSESDLKVKKISSYDERNADVKKSNTDENRLIEEENVEVGKVKWSVFTMYLRSLGVKFSVIIFMIFVCYQVFLVGGNIWLSKWTSDPILTNRTISLNDSTLYMDKNKFYLGIYGALGVGQSIAIMIYSMLALLRMIKAAGKLHAQMLMNILRLPMSFFDTTPLGRIVNRFSHDIDTIDNDLPWILQNFIEGAFIILTTALVISYSTPIFLSVILPIGIIYFLIQRFYIATSRQLKRLNTKTKSPIYSHFNETLTGVQMIRAFGVEDRFILESEKRVDTNQQYIFASYMANRWLGIRLEFVGSIVILAASLFAVFGRDVISGSLMGLSISYAMETTGSLNWFVRIMSQLEQDIVSVERVKEYIDKPTEAEWSIEETRPPLAWPDNGDVHFQQYSARYRPGLSLVLKNISVSIAPGEKIGIVGRTGAGKSSLTVGLFRLIEPAEGTVIIDGVDITKLGLHDLRSKLTILPQDPVLFSGSLRMNIDPVETYADDELWTALEHSHLKSFVVGLEAKLEYECGEGGQNLSVGQRQLVCLARSLLHKTKVLILDEATAAVDMATDDLIQKTIRTEFKDCTVLTIAHRLNTVMDYDRILVLDNGEIKEFDSPQNLLARTDTIFYKMAKDAGVADFSAS